MITSTGLLLIDRLAWSIDRQTRTASLFLTPEDTASGLQAAPSKTPLITPSTSTTPWPEHRDQTETSKPEDLFNLLPPGEIDQRPNNPYFTEHLKRLMVSDYPARDYYENLARLGSSDPGNRFVLAKTYQPGDRQRFHTDDGTVEAELVAVTDDVFFWVETGLNLNKDDIVKAAQRFQDEYLPRVRYLFGDEWRPGIDNDPRFSVLHLEQFTDESELGFFDSGDEYPRTVNSASNEQEIVYLNMSSLDPGDDLYFGTLVHEMQHLIHWHNDANETVWLNEGLSQLAELYVGLKTVDAAVDYLARPETQLNTWQYQDEDLVFAQYGAAYLFLVYTWEKLGDQAITELVQHPANGVAAVQAILDKYQPGVTLASFVGDWSVANFLDNPMAGDRYDYANINLEEPELALTVKDFPFSTVERIDQFGVQYIAIDANKTVTLTLAGDTTAPVVPIWPHSGRQMWFAPPQNELDARLTAVFDLSSIKAATLQFWTWYDLEEDFDFGYLSISTDGGDTWELLLPQHAKAGEFGPAFGGRSVDEPDQVDGWVSESVSLNSYVGNTINIRFEVLTDSALNGAGFAIDDITIPELGYVSDTEILDNRWENEGFVMTGRQLPQIWSVNLITTGPNPQVTPLELDLFNQGRWSIETGPEGSVLSITPLTPFVSQPASYWLQVEDAGE